MSAQSNRASEANFRFMLGCRVAGLGTGDSSHECGRLFCRRGRGAPSSEAGHGLLVSRTWPRRVDIGAQDLVRARREQVRAACEPAMLEEASSGVFNRAALISQTHRFARDRRDRAISLPTDPLALATTFGSASPVMHDAHQVRVNAHEGQLRIQRRSVRP